MKLSTRTEDLADRLFQEFTYAIALGNVTPYHFALNRVVAALDWVTPKLRRRGF